MKLARSILSAVIFAAMAGIAVAAEPTLEAARRCSTVTDIIARVTCYDRVFGTAASAPVVAPAPTSAPASAGAAVAGTTVAAAIGDENLKKSSAERAVTATPAAAEAKITEVREMSANTLRISLDNGQVWQTQEGQSWFKVEVGDTLRIDRRSMGGYVLARVVDGKPGNVVRAIRQK